MAELDGLAGLEGQQRVVAELVLLELVAEQASRERRGVDRDAGELRQDVRQPADVVLVRVRDDEGLDLLAPRAQVLHVRHDEVDAEHLLLGEHQAAVDDDDLVVELEDREVLADLADAAERDDLEQLGRRRERGAGVHATRRAIQKRPSWGSGAVLGAHRATASRSLAPVGDWAVVGATAGAAGWSAAAGAAGSAAPAGAAGPPVSARAVRARIERVGDAGHVALHRHLERPLPERRCRVVHRIGASRAGAASPGRPGARCHAPG